MKTGIIDVNEYANPMLQTHSLRGNKTLIRWQLLGTAGSWFILDIVFYANGLFSGYQLLIIINIIIVAIIIIVGVLVVVVVETVVVVVAVVVVVVAVIIAVVVATDVSPGTFRPPLLIYY